MKLFYKSSPTTAFQFAEQSLVDFLKTRELFQAEPIEFVSVDNCFQVEPSYERALPDLTRNLQVPRELCVDYTKLGPFNKRSQVIVVSSILCRYAKSCCVCLYSLLMPMSVFAQSL